jgi:pilus assembly protein Flp/PilA
LVYARKPALLDHLLSVPILHGSASGHRRSSIVIQSFRRLLGCQQGATAVEYGLIIALIVLAIIGALSGVATKTNAMWSNISDEVNNH